MILWCDFETKSECDLTVHGVYNYARHPTTEVLCLSWAIDDGPVTTWLPSAPHVNCGWMDVVKTAQVRAHNAAFERLITWYVLQLNPTLEQFWCTATQARANCAPGSLEDAGRFAGASMRKDYRGSQLIRKCCIPPFDHTEQDFLDLIAYCEQDVRAMREISKAMRPLSDEELADYHVSERINDRGVLVDVPLCRAAVGYAAEELAEIQARVTELTEGAVPTLRSPVMKDWVLARVGAEARKLMTVHKDGETKTSIDKAVRANLLILAEDNPDEVPADVAEVIQCADDVWASSVAKFARLADLADEDDHRVRGAFVFNGGSATGRWASYGAQVHNFTRKVLKTPLEAREAMVRGSRIVPEFGKRTSDVLKGMLRPALVPEKGNVFIVADWSSIEGRMNPWLANSEQGEAKLEVFRQGLDPYIVNAVNTFGGDYAALAAAVEAEEPWALQQRQVGKVQELSLGYAGADGAFASMGRGFGILLPEPQIKKAVAGWRRANPWAVNYWSQLEHAYTTAMRRPRQEVSVGRVTYLFDKTHLWYCLPSGRVLCYPYARFDEEGITYAKASWKPGAGATEWPRARLWKGLACENITQAAANDILRSALRGLDCVVLHVHDEIVLEVRATESERYQELLGKVMCEPPAWAPGLPLAVGVKVMERYGK